MCGIAGALTPREARPLPAEVLTGMAQRLRHRGPDAAGVWLDGSGVGLAHARLSIVDLSDVGLQPKRSRDGRYILVFNGEIYNHRELRKMLENEGSAFEGLSDTEVLVEGIARWGLDATLRRCDGMFALAVWDRVEHVLKLARDRFGEKPLYYGRLGSDFVFASELKAFRSHPKWDTRRLNQSEVPTYLNVGYVPSPHSIFEGIKKLPPGTMLSLTQASRVAPEDLPTPIAYWTPHYLADLRPPATPTSDKQAAVAVERMRDVLTESVDSRLHADVTVGAFLSGGIDSSLIVALCQRVLGRSMATFTLGSSNPSMDESSQAHAISSHLGTAHHAIRAEEADLVGSVQRLVEIYDEPFADSSSVATYLVSSFAARSVGVCLTGDAGDELFGGYDRYRLVPSAMRAARAIPSLLRPAIANGLSKVTAARRNREIFRRANTFSEFLSFDDSGQAFQRMVAHWPGPEAVLRREVAQGSWAMSDRKSWPHFRSDIDMMLWLDLVTYLPDNNLMKVDRASMAFGLETRIPMLQPAVVEAAWSAPDDLLIRNGKSKWLLRRILDAYVPEKLLVGPKRGFSVPVRQWLQGPLNDWASDLLFAPEYHDEGLLDRDVIQRLWLAEGTGDQAPAVEQIWGVIVLLAWLRHSAAPITEPEDRRPIAVADGS